MTQPATHAPSTSAEARRIRRPNLVFAIELFALTGLAVAQPLFDILGKNPSLFIAWQTSSLQFVAFVLVIVLGPALLLWVVESVVGMYSTRIRGRLHLLIVGVLGAVIAVEILKKMFGPTLTVSLAVAVGVGLVFARRVTAVQTWLRFVAVAPLAFAVLFVFSSAVTPVAFRTRVEVAKHVTIQRPHRVVMIVFDEFPLVSLLNGKGQIDATLFPTFARFSHQASWYRDSTTVAPFTEAAVPAILSGQMPTDPKALPIAEKWPHSILTLLGDKYSLNVHESVTSLCPDGACSGPPPHTGVRSGFGGTLRDVADIWWQLASPSRQNSVAFGGLGGADPHGTVTATRFIDSIKPSSSPSLDVLHLLMPHAPWHYNVYGQDYESLPPHRDGLDKDVWHDDWVATLARQRHLLQVQTVDSLLGSVIQRLKTIGAYDDSLIVVTADHGADFTGGQPFRGATSRNLSSILWTPLFIKAPNQVLGIAHDEPARSIDVVPTVADILGVKVPWQMDGRSLLQPSVPADRRQFLKWSRSELQPKAGQRYVSYDPKPWFAKVLSSAASTAPTGDIWRLYRIGPLATKIGDPVASWIGSPASAARVKLDNQRYYSNIATSAPFISWMDAHGYVRGVAAGRWLAIAINGRLAGTYRTYATAGGESEFWGLLPVGLFRNGSNDVKVYEFSGTDVAPRLALLG